MQWDNNLVKKFLLFILVNLFLQNVVFADSYYFKECKLNENTYGNYSINIDKNEINVVLKTLDGRSQKYTDKIKLITKNKVLSELIESKKIKNFFTQYSLNVKTKTIARQGYIKTTSDILRPEGPKKTGDCKDIKANWNIDKIENTAEDKEQEEILKIQKKIMEKESEEQSSASLCKGSDYKKWNNCKGVYVDESKIKYEGKFKNGKILEGVATYPGGSIYLGQFKNFRPDGMGTFTDSSGSKYYGEWKNGVEQGTGTKTWKDGRKYTGQFENDKPHGKGTFVFPDGSKYVGDFKNGKRHGEGTLTYADGTAYLGKFIDGEEHGGGTCFDKSGESVECKKDIRSTGRNTHNITIVAKKWIKLSEYETVAGKGKKIIDKLRKDFDVQAAEVCMSTESFSVLEKKIEVLEMDETPAFGLEPKLKIAAVGVVECK